MQVFRVVTVAESDAAWPSGSRIWRTCSSSKQHQKQPRQKLCVTYICERLSLFQQEHAGADVPHKPVEAGQKPLSTHSAARNRLTMTSFQVGQLKDLHAKTHGDFAVVRQGRYQPRLQQS